MRPSYWRSAAREVIRVADAALPPDATLAERRRALRDVYPFGVRKWWPYKAWLLERRLYLATCVRSMDDVPPHRLTPLEQYIRARGK